MLCRSAWSLLLLATSVPPVQSAEITVTSGGPLKTLSAAVEVSRKQSDGPHRIVLAAGRYYLEQTLVLDAQDSDLSIEGAGPGKTIVYGGRRITDWRKDGERLWVADIPAVKNGQWDFRALVVNDRLCPRARLPEAGRFEHESVFPVRWMSSAGGGWERKPTPQELTTMQYRAGDLPSMLSVRNAEVTVYHMWDESMVGLAAHDPATRVLTFATGAKSPPGAFGVKTYVLWNVREGLTRPGQWCLDRDRGQVVYWPLADENMQQALAIAPCVETLIEIKGSKQKTVSKVAIHALTLSTTTTPCKPGGFGASEYRGAVQTAFGQDLRFENVEITNTAGHAFCDRASRGLTIENCRMHHVGAGGCRLGEGSALICGNQLHHVGLLYPSAIGISVGGRDSQYVVRRNEIHHTPYSGMSAGGTGLLIEENLLHHCMQELHDGAAIYVSGAKGAVIRRNLARDVVPIGSGYGVSAYYLDEKCRDCTVERNVSIGVQRPTHNHMTLNCTLRDNVFLCEGDMDLSFARSAGFHVTGNTLQLAGKLKIADPDAIAEWKDNVIIQATDAGPAISSAMPTTAAIPRDKPRYANVLPLMRPPVLDGKLGGQEWPSGGSDISELSDQRRARGAPLLVKFCADVENFYVAVAVVSMFPEDRKLGHAWGRDEGVELALEGRRTDGQPVVYVLRGFADGQFESMSLGGATVTEAKSATAVVGYAAAVDKQVWRCEWRVPLAMLRFVPKRGTALPCNVTVYRSENHQFIQFAGSRGATWDLKLGGRLMFSVPSASSAKQASESPHSLGK